MKIPPAMVHALTPIFATATSMRRRVIPPQLAAMELATGIWPALALRAFVKSGIADHLAKGAATPEQIARDLSLHEPSVRRVLRVLAAYDVVSGEAGTFSLTEIGLCAAAGNPNSVTDFLLYVGEPWQLEPWEHLDETLRTGKPAFEITYGAAFFDYMKAHPDIAKDFDRAMNAVAKLHAGAIAGAYDFSNASPIADIGGGSGLVIDAILLRFPGAHAVLFDRPPALEDARAQLAEFAERVELVPGDFFESAPAAKTYILAHILHDWDDENALKILANVRRAMLKGGRVLIAEAIYAENPNAWSAAALTDAQMLAMLPGRERTLHEYKNLLKRAGLRVERVVPTAAAESLIVASRDDV